MMSVVAKDVVVAAVDPLAVVAPAPALALPSAPVMTWIRVCHCKWKVECREIQKVLHENKPGGPYTGCMQVRPIKLTDVGKKSVSPDKKNLLLN